MHGTLLPIVDCYLDESSDEKREQVFCVGGIIASAYHWTAIQNEWRKRLAGIDYLRGLSYVDTKRLAVMGWSFGGVVSMLAAARGPAFLAAVDQAGGALTWDGNSHMRSALIAAAEKSTTPTLFMVAKNDRTTASVTTLADVFKKRNVPHKLVIYEPFTPSQGGRFAPGHALFSSQGVSLWENDVIEFLGRYLR